MYKNVQEVGSRWQSRNILSSPPPMGTPKLQLLTEQLSLRKRYSTTKDIKKEPH